MSKNYNEELADLNRGPVNINDMIKSCSRVKVDKWFRAKDIQEARIDFFKRGYNFCKRELNNQKKLL